MNQDNNIRLSEQEKRDYERIENFLFDEMTFEEEKEFLVELESNPDLKEKAIATARLAKGVREVGRAKDEVIIEVIRSIDQETIQNTIGDIAACPIVPFAAHRILLIAASLLIFFIMGWGGFYSYDRYQTITLGEQYYEQYVPSGYVKGNKNEEIETEITKLSANVREGKELSSTIARLDNLWQQSTNNTYNDYTEYATVIGWNLAIAYLKDNDKKNAKLVLTQLHMQHNYHKASELLQKIN